MNGDKDGQQSGWVFKPGGSATPPVPNPNEPSRPAATASEGAVEWTASEYVAHEKHGGWYAQVLLAAIIIAVLVYFITRDAISTGVIVFAGLVFVVAAARKPRVIAYRVDPGGLTAGQRYYPFSQFKSYAVMQQGPLVTVMFMPLKRFMPTVDIYLPPESAEAILMVLADNLSLETRKPGLVDNLANRIRF